MSDLDGIDRTMADPTGPLPLETEAEQLGGHVSHSTLRRQGVRTAATLYLGSMAAALLISALLVSLTGGSASKVFSALLDGSLRSPGAWGLTLTTMAPLLLVALGTILATKAGLVNIGQEGQVIIGAAFAAWFAVRVPGPGDATLAAALVAGVVGGGLWSGLAAALRWRQVPEVISTLLLVFIAFQLTSYGLSQRWLIGDRDTERINRVNTGEQLPADAKMPTIEVFGNTFDLGVIVSLLVAVVLAFVLGRTIWGFRLRMLGLNPRAAHRAGVSANRFGTSALVLSGGLAGLAGAVLLTGRAAGDRFSPGFSDNYGWQGLLVALLARDRPILAVPMAFVFACLRTGGGFLAATGVERKIVDVVQALVVLALLIPPAVLFIRDRRLAMAAATART